MHRKFGIVLMVIIILLASIILFTTEDILTGKTSQSFFFSGSDCNADIDTRCNAINNMNVDLCDSNGYWDTGINDQGHSYCGTGYVCDMEICDQYDQSSPCCIID